ncbi:hypothetical protein [Halalkalibacter alkalisediminis]|uniref:Beta galactosidase small chain/ domain-containing protein n=2 Tax=Halalkalibacter alkalisediminis TaxID=935616 RepID=A0ABV6NI59_9BACI
MGKGDWRLECLSFDFSAHYYSTKQFDQAKHSYDFNEEDQITLTIEYKQPGLCSLVVDQMYLLSISC